jgi:hypothetical protein
MTMQIARSLAMFADILQSLGTEATALLLAKDHRPPYVPFDSRQLNIAVDTLMRVLKVSHPLKASFIQALKACTSEIYKNEVSQVLFWLWKWPIKNSILFNSIKRHFLTLETGLLAGRCQGTMPCCQTQSRGPMVPHNWQCDSEGGSSHTSFRAETPQSQLWCTSSFPTKPTRYVVAAIFPWHQISCPGRAFAILTVM